MSKSKGPLYYAPLVQRIEEMDASIKDMKMKIERIRVSFCEHDPDNTVNNPDEIEENVRVTRDYALQMSDWTQMPDSPLPPEKKSAWADYRQKLRDLPEQCASAKSLADIIFPKKPSN